MTRVCDGPIRAAVGDLFSDAEIDDVIERAARRYKSMRKKNPNIAEEDIWRAVAENMTKQQLLDTAAIRKQELAALRAKARRNQKFKRMGNDIDDVKKTRIMNVGDESEGYGRGRSVDAMGRANFLDLAGTFVRDLEEEGLLNALASPFKKRDKVLERKVARDMEHLNGGSRGPSGDEDAMKIAKAAVKQQGRGRNMMNREGAFIAQLSGRVSRQTHDAIKVSGGFFKGVGSKARREKARSDWKNTILPLLDERTFEDVENIDKFLNRIWSDIVHGRHHASGDGLDLDGYRPPPSMARTVSSRRVLHFKNSDAWLDYNEKFGTSTLFQSIVGELEKAGRNAALMNVWGPSPRAAFENHMARIKDNTDDVGNRFQRSQEWLREAEFDQLDGSAEAFVSPRFSSIVRNIKMQQVLSKLGGMTVSSLSDNPLAANALRHAGVSYLDGYSEVIQGLTRLQGKEKIHAADMTNVAVRSMIGDVASRFSAMDGGHGVMGKMQDMFYKVNFFDFWQKGIRRGVGAALSMNLGKNVNVPWSKLEPTFRAGLERYEIDTATWAVIRRAGQKLGADPDGRIWVTPESIDAIPNASVAKWAKRAEGFNPERIDEARDEIRLRLQAYFSDIADNAMTEPRARERALIHGKAHENVLGPLVGLIAQFKSFPLTVLTRHVLPGFDKGYGSLKPTATVTHLLAGMFALGFIAMQAKQLLRGLTPRPLTDDEGRPNMKTLQAAMLQGGGFGIMGDFLFADYSRYGTSVTATLAGPAVGEGEKLIQLIHATAHGQDTGARWLRAGLRNTPFTNLFYTRTAMDYMFLYQLQEMVSPGSLARYEKDVRDNRGQEFLKPPTEAIN